jgi:hypothetical protein
MKPLLPLLTLACALTLGVAHAADEPAPTAQQNRMVTCNQDAGDRALQGEARKTFMKACLSGQTVPATRQQIRMIDCNRQAQEKALKGDERQAFMKTCLSAAAPTEAAATPDTPQTRMTRCNADATAQSLRGDERKKFMSECLKG